jgi:hypothetical protein
MNLRKTFRVGRGSPCAAMSVLDEAPSVLWADFLRAPHSI